MSFEVVLKDAFLKDFMAVPQSTQNGITRSLNALKLDPFRAPNVKRVSQRIHRSNTRSSPNF